AFIRDEPAITSGPTTGAMLTWAAAAIRESGLHVTAIVAAPIDFAYSIAPSVYGVLPLADIATTASRDETLFASRSRAACLGSSSAASTARCRASYPPAMI